MFIAAIHIYTRNIHVDALHTFPLVKAFLANEVKRITSPKATEIGFLCYFEGCCYTPASDKSHLPQSVGIV